MLLTVLQLLNCSLVSAQSTPNPRDNFYSKDPSNPIEIVIQKTFGKEADSGSETRGRYGDINKLTGQREIDPAVPFGPSTVPLTTVAAGSKKPLRLIFDYAGYTTEAKHTSPPRPVIELLAKAYCSPSPQSCLTGENTYIWDSPAERSGVTRAKVTVGGVDKFLLTGRAELALKIPPDQQAKIFLAIHSFTLAEMRDLRVTALYGDYSEEPPSDRLIAKAWLKKQQVGRFTPLIVLAAMLVMGLYAFREFQRDDRNEDAPAVFGVLLAILGLAMAGMMLIKFSGIPSPLYFVVVGLLWAMSGVCLYFGRPAARFWYGLSLIVVWACTIIEYDLMQKQFYAQVVMPTIYGLYLFSWRISGRLE